MMLIQLVITIDSFSRSIFYDGFKEIMIVALNQPALQIGIDR